MSVPPAEALRLLDTDIDGLTETEAQRRLQEYGLNKLQEQPSKHPLKLFLEQFQSILVVILIIAVGVARAIWIWCGSGSYNPMRDILSST